MELKQPNLVEVLDKAIIIATNCHKGQVDKGGEPYILHPLRVMTNVSSLEGKICAVLHDVLEDCDITQEELVDMGIPYYLTEVLLLLSREIGTPYMDYISKIKTNKIAREVKNKDLDDNMNSSRLKHITEKDIKRIKKYQKAKKFLNED